VPIPIEFRASGTDRHARADRANTYTHADFVRACRHRKLTPANAAIINAYFICHVLHDEPMRGKVLGVGNVPSAAMEPAKRESGTISFVERLVRMKVIGQTVEILTMSFNPVSYFAGIGTVFVAMPSDSAAAC